MRPTHQEAYETSRQEILTAADEHEEILVLTGRKLRHLPPEIGILTSLRYLVLEDNELTSLPSEIGSLTALEMGGLKSLELLELDQNQLERLPLNWAV